MPITYTILSEKNPACDACSCEQESCERSHPPIQDAVLHSILAVYLAVSENRVRVGDTLIATYTVNSKMNYCRVFNHDKILQNSLTPDNASKPISFPDHFLPNCCQFLVLYTMCSLVLKPL